MGLQTARLETASPDPPRGTRWLTESGKRWKLQKIEGSGTNRAAERDTTGSNGRQHPFTYVD
jgi:hypothetical protein